jgi:hypothetical protein
MGISQALNTGCHTTIHLNRLQFREQLVYRQSLILLILENGLDLSVPNGTITTRNLSFYDKIHCDEVKFGHIM